MEIRFVGAWGLGFPLHPRLPKPLAQKSYLQVPPATVALQASATMGRLIGDGASAGRGVLKP